MSLFPLLQPDLVLGSSVLNLTPGLLAQHQIKGLVLDVDDTIVSIGSKVAQPEIVSWIAEISQIGPICLVTNNPNEGRISAIASSLSLPYFLRAGKPSRKKLRQAVTNMGLEPAQVAMVGDRVFTDVLAGNRLGMFSILIEPMPGDDNSFNFELLRRVEFTLAQILGVSLKGHKS